MFSANGTIKGSITGVPMRSPVQKVWRVSQAIGDIAFAYPYSLILLEIQVTGARLPLPELQRATNLSNKSSASLLPT
jgi:hypothetical protein